MRGVSRRVAAEGKVERRDPGGGGIDYFALVGVRTIYRHCGIQQLCEVE